MRPKNLNLKRLLFSLTAIFLLHATCLAQNRLVGNTYTHRDGFCSTVLRFLNDSIFSCNRGCESRGYTYYGRYKVKSDSVFFENGMKDTALKVLRIDSSRQEDNYVLLRFFNQNNINITNQFRATFLRSNGANYSFTYDSASQTLKAPEFDMVELNIRTLRRMGLNGIFKNIDSRGLKLDYFIQIPEWIAKDFMNKDIATSGNNIMTMKDDQLLPVYKEDNPWELQPVIFKKNNY